MDHIVHGVAKSQTQLSDFHFALLGGSVGKESACNAGDLALISRSGRSSREGNGNPLQYSCLENPMDRGNLWATVHAVPRVGHDLMTKPPLSHFLLGLPPPIPLKHWSSLKFHWFLTFCCLIQQSHIAPNLNICSSHPTLSPRPSVSP